MGWKISDIDLNKLSEDQRELINCIGIESYYKLAQYYGGSQIYIARPNALDKLKRNGMIIKEFEDGASYKEIAVKYGLTTVWVRKIISGEA